MVNQIALPDQYLSISQLSNHIVSVQNDSTPSLHPSPKTAPGSQSGSPPWSHLPAVHGKAERVEISTGYYITKLVGYFRVIEISLYPVIL